jgi:hypothetical protein
MNTIRRRLASAASRASTRRFASTEHGGHSAPKEESLGVGSSRLPHSGLGLTWNLDGLLHHRRRDPRVIYCLLALESGGGWQALRPVEGDQQILGVPRALVNTELDAHGYDRASCIR